MDSFGGKVGDPRSLHKYLYAAASPILLTDPTGESFFSGVMVALGVVGIVLSAYSFYNDPNWVNGAWLVADLVTFPLAWMKAVGGVGKALFVSGRAAQATADSRGAAMVLGNLTARGEKLMYSSQQLVKELIRRRQGMKAADFITSVGERAAITEVTSTLRTDEVIEALGKFSDTGHAYLERIGRLGSGTDHLADFRLYYENAFDASKLRDGFEVIGGYLYKAGEAVTRHGRRIEILPIEWF